jgi:hypothetical protein
MESTHPASTFAQKLSVLKATDKLCFMLQSMLQRYPKARVVIRRGAFGVLLDADTSLYVSFNGNFNLDLKRDCLDLFSTWLLADPEGLEPARTLRDG